MTKFLFLPLILLSGYIFGPEPFEVTAVKLWKEKKYKEAREYFEKALESRADQSNVMSFNLGQCLNQLDSVILADESFNRAEDAPDKKVSSMAYNNRGVFKVNDKKLEESLEFFKDALRKDPSNEEARYNYELIKKYLEKQQPPPPQDNNQPPPPQQNQQKPKSQENTGQNSGDENEISKAEAKALLDAMEQTEMEARKNMKLQFKGKGSKNTPAW